MTDDEGSPPELKNVRVSRLVAGSVIINGITLSESVAEQLRELGLPLKWYMQGELRDVREADWDCHLIKNPDGIFLHDKIHAPQKTLHDLSGIAEAIGKPVRTLNMHMLGISTAIDNMQAQLDDIRSLALGICGIAPIPASEFISE